MKGYFSKLDFIDKITQKIYKKQAKIKNQATRKYYEIPFIHKFLLNECHKGLKIFKFGHTGYIPNSATVKSRAATQKSKLQQR